MFLFKFISDKLIPILLLFVRKNTLKTFNLKNWATSKLLFLSFIKFSLLKISINT